MTITNETTPQQPATPSLEGSPGLGQDALTERAEALKGFKPTGNFEQDVETFLTLSGREGYIDGILSGKVDARAVLSEIRAFLNESLDPDSDLYHSIAENDPDRSHKELFYRQIPELEVQLLDQVLAEGLLTNEAEEVKGLEPDTEEAFLGEPRIHEVDGEQLERIESLRQHIESKFQSYKRRHMELAGKLDNIFFTSRGALAGLSGRFPGGLSPEFLPIVDEEYTKNKRALEQRFATIERGQRVMESWLSLPGLLLNNEKIVNLLERLINEMFATIEEEQNRQDQLIEGLQERLEDTLTTIEGGLRQKQEEESAKTEGDATASNETEITAESFRKTFGPSAALTQIDE